MNEKTYIKEVALDYRKRHGQFFTPNPVAKLMVEWILKSKPERVLDPAFGLGVFYDELKKLEHSRRINFVGYEIDSHILSYFKGDTNGDLEIICNDYLEANVGLFGAIICNPPYMRFQNFLNRHSVLPKVEEIVGGKLMGYSNIASVFLIKSLYELQEDARLAYIMPFEFFNTGYGEAIKKTLIDKKLLKHIIIFENEKDIFPEATTTVCILLCHNNGAGDALNVSIINNQQNVNDLTLNSLNSITVGYVDMPANKKWSPIIRSFFMAEKIPANFTTVSNYGKFKRGIATGANNYFSFNKLKIDELSLPNTNLKKCITKSALVKSMIFTEDDFARLAKNNKNIYCLDVKSKEDVATVSYLKLGEGLGIHKKYLTSKRNPWFKLEERDPSPILFGVFNRGRLKVIRNYTDAVNFTCFHSFYPNRLGEKYVDRLFVYLISDIGQAILKMNKRSYGRNLDKLEPGDLNECMCPCPGQFDLIKDDEVNMVIDNAKHDAALAIKYSNKIIERVVSMS